MKKQLPDIDIHEKCSGKHVHYVPRQERGVEIRFTGSTNVWVVLFDCKETCNEWHHAFTPFVDMWNEFDPNESDSQTGE